MLNLAHYQQTETLYTGTRTLVYRALHLSDRQPVIIKVLRNPLPHFNELVQFRNQYIIAQRFDSPLIVKPLALEHYGNGYALIVPDQGAISLASYWRGADRGIRELLTIAIQLAAALHLLAGQQVIHKDIKPANILIHPETKQVQLIDFSIASLLPREQQPSANPAGLEGTLAYISPEQTGRMNRALDYRTDFYALGVTLYELLTGTVPFKLSDPLELIHCHIAQSPTAPVGLLDAQGRAYPATLSAIIMKLMAKNTEDRYQSALGLQHDLEQCLASWKQTGEIADFELGERDICDRFNIPEKLYGREQEVQTLLAAFDRAAQGSRETLLVAGFSGIGKTAVVNEVHKPIVKKRGYFIKGKFDQLNRNIPLSAFVQAFRELMKQILGESDAALSHWRDKILTALGDSGQVIIDVIPELENAIGKQPDVPKLSGSAAQNRFNRLFEEFIAVFTTKQHPLVLFLDDLQWVDSASLNLIEVLMRNQDRGYLLLLGAYRDNEVCPTHPLMLTVSKLREYQAALSTLTLVPLAVHHLNQLVAETLSCQVEQAQPLTELLYQKTQGNPFFSTQFLKRLYADELIAFNREQGYWECDLVKVQDAALTDDVVVFMTDRLQKFPEATQTALKLAACIGNQFDLDTVALVRERSPEVVAGDLWRALQDGMIVPTSDAYKFFQGDLKPTTTENVTVRYRFLHDRVQQASYALIPADQQPATHLKIGQLLQRHCSESEHSVKQFEIVNHLNQGQALLTEPDQREALARLNLQAAQQAQAAIAYTTALDYCQQGLGLLSDCCWQQQYDLTLELHNCAANNAYLTGDFAQISQWLTPVLQQARSLLDRLTAYEIQIDACKAQNQHDEAIEIALDVLAQLGIHFPASPRPWHFAWALLKARLAQRGRPIDTLAQLPVMTEPRQKAAMRIFTRLSAAIYIARPALFPLMIFKKLELSLRWGNAPESVYAYATYAIILCSGLGQIDAGYEFSRLALKLPDQLAAENYRAAALLAFNFVIRHWREPLKNSLDGLLLAYRVGLEAGDLEIAALGLHSQAYFAYCAGAELTQLRAELVEQQMAIAKLNQTDALLQHNLCLDVVSALVGGGDRTELLAGDIAQGIEQIALPPQTQGRTAITLSYIQQMTLAYWFGSPTLALSYSKLAQPNLDAIIGRVDVVLFHFYQALIQLDLCGEQPDTARKRFAKQITRNRKKLRNWAQYSPQNYQHKADLLDAEWYRVTGQKIEAMTAYEQAITGAKANEYIQEEGLANERFAKFYLDWGRTKEATLYLQEAYYGYSRWGAKAKTSYLEASYPELLTSVLQKQRATFNPLHSFDALTKTLTANIQSTTHSSSSSLSEALDFATILRAAQKLSSTIDLSKLLGDITEIILTNTGAQKMVLLAPVEQQWQLQASAELVDGKAIANTATQPLTPESPVPIRLIQYVKNTKTSVLIGEAKTELTGILEGYLLKYQPQSVLCVPLLNQGRLVAIAYLEHPTTKGVFTPNRQTIVEFLCAQAAVALQNAQLYQQAQHSQNQAEQALANLQQTQLQLVQSEKMSALGNLVAGVAHEINNPVGFLRANIQPAQNHIQDLLGLIDLYQEQFPSPGVEIEDEIEAVDLEFVRADLPNLIESMNAGIDRIRNISNSLRTFSRADREHQTAFNIHEGIDSTLLILKHRTKANEQRPKIKIAKQYGQLPEVQCFPGQLNQVFMNIIANAIDALDEANQGKLYQDIKQDPNQIAIQTSVVHQQVQIQIQDNGCGMKPETVARIFEQGFTTKEVGKGTGLGMAIAHQIITEKHGGSITCASKLGQGTVFTINLPTTHAPK